MLRPKSSRDHFLSGKERKLYANQDPWEGPLMLVRYNDWQERFFNFILESRREGIKCDWEFHHCASWTAMGVQEITGYDYYEQWREYTIESPGDAYLTLRRLGFQSLDQYAECNFIEKPLALANRGDIVMVPAPEFADLGMPNAMGLAEPPFVWVLREDGLGRANLFDCTRAFAVGSLG